jgi:hypothetical protein
VLGLERCDFLRRRRPEIGQLDFAQVVGTHIPDCDQPAILAGRHRDDSRAAIGGGEGVGRRVWAVGATACIRRAGKFTIALTNTPNCAILDSQHTPWLPRNDAVSSSRSFPRWVARSAAAPDVWSLHSQAHRFDN